MPCPSLSRCQDHPVPFFSQATQQQRKIRLLQGYLEEVAKPTLSSTSLRRHQVCRRPDFTHPFSFVRILGLHPRATARSSATAHCHTIAGWNVGVGAVSETRRQRLATRQTRLLVLDCSPRPGGRACASRDRPPAGQIPGRHRHETHPVPGKCACVARRAAVPARAPVQRVPTGGQT